MLKDYNFLLLTPVSHPIIPLRKLLRETIYWSDNTVSLSLSRFIYNAFIVLGNNFGMLTPVIR